jgi:hypothetical protein
MSFTFYKLREIANIIAEEVLVSTATVTTVLLLDRYDDLSRSQQIIANGLFNLPPPRTIYIIAGVAPPGLTTLDLPNGQRLQEYQHFRTVSIEKSVRFDDYVTLAATIARKYLVAARLPHSNLKINLQQLLESNPSVQYSGLASFARLSDSIIFNFLLLCEAAVESSGPMSALRSGGQISAHAQAQAAKKVARVLFANISSKIAGSYGPIKHLIAELLKRFASEDAGPSVIFNDLQGQPEMDVVSMAVRESILKEADDEPRTLDAFVAAVNRIFLPYRDLSLADRRPLELSLEELRSILADADKVYGPTKKQIHANQIDLFAPPLVPLTVSPAPSKRWESAMYEFTSFLKQSHVGAHIVQSGLEYSHSVINEAVRDLTPGIYKTFREYDFLANVSVGLAGSFGRGEAQQDHSDADLFVVGNLAGKEQMALDLLEHCCDWFRNRNIEVTTVQTGVTIKDQRFQPFPTPIDLDTITKNAAKPQDSDEDRTRRMALISESVSLFNEGHFEKVRQQLMDLYRIHDYLSSNSLPLSLLNEFMFWCKSFISRIEVQRQSGVKYDKRRHQRLFMQWSTVLASVAHLSNDSKDASATFREVFDLPAVLRLYHILRMSYDDNRPRRASHVKAILKLYNDGLVSLRAPDAAGTGPSHEAAIMCTEMMLGEFQLLQSAILEEADPRLQKNYGQIAFH